MKILKYLLLGIVSLLVLLGLISFALPSAYKIQRSIDINAPMQVVYPMVYDPKAWAKWGVWNRRDPGMAMTYSGPPAGPGAKWSWVSKSEGSGTMECTGAEFNKSISYKISFADFDGSFNGRLEFAQVDKAVRVTWTTEGDVGSNPLMRYFAVVMDRMLGPILKAG